MYIILRNVLFILSFSLAYAGYFMHVLVDKEIKTPMKKYNEEVTIGDDLEFQKLTVITNKNFKLCSMFVCI